MLTFVEPLGPECVAACLEADGHEVIEAEASFDPPGFRHIRPITLTPRVSSPPIIGRTVITGGSCPVSGGRAPPWKCRIHGTSTPMNDKFETIAVKRVFNGYSYKVPMSSTKSMTGHLLGAAGAVEAIYSIMAIRTGVVPPTINLDDPDDGLDLDVVTHKARHMEIPAALNNSFGFGGHNACLVMGPWRD